MADLKSEYHENSPEVKLRHLLTETHDPNQVPARRPQQIAQGKRQGFQYPIQLIIKLHQSDTDIELLRMCISFPARGARHITYPNKDANLLLLSLLINLNIGYSGRCIQIALNFHSGFYFTSLPVSDK